MEMVTATQGQEVPLQVNTDFANLLFGSSVWSLSSLFFLISSLRFSHMKFAGKLSIMMVAMAVLSRTIVG
jgi:hypothetical protein